MESRRFISCDLLFSYWVLLWFFVYGMASFFTKENKVCRWIYENTNPFLLFCVALLSSIRNLVMILLYNPQWQLIATHVAKFIFLKGIPMLYLVHQPIKVLENLMFSVFLLVLYLFYLMYKKENMFLLYEEMSRTVIHGKSNTSLEYVLGEIQKRFIPV